MTGQPGGVDVVVELAYAPGAAHPLGAALRALRRAAAAAEDPVPRGRLVLPGDDPDIGQDSRRMAFFPADAVLGGVVRSR